MSEKEREREIKAGRKTADKVRKEQEGGRRGRGHVKASSPD